MAFASYSAFVLFPRLILRSLPPGFNGKHAAIAFAKRCKLLMDGQAADLIREARDS